MWIKTKINIKHASNLMVVPPKKAAVKYSWFFCLTASMPVTKIKVRAVIKINTVQKLLTNKLVLPLYCSNAGGIAIMMINSKKERIEGRIFINKDI